MLRAIRSRSSRAQHGSNRAKTTPTNTHTHARDAPIVLDLNERQHGTASWRRGSRSLRHYSVRWRCAPFPQYAETSLASKSNGTNGIQKTTNSSDCRSSIHTVEEPTTTPNNVNKESLQPLTRTVQSSNKDDDNNSQPERTITPATMNNVQAGISSSHKNSNNNDDLFYYCNTTSASTATTAITIPNDCSHNRCCYFCAYNHSSCYYFYCCCCYYDSKIRNKK